MDNLSDEELEKAAAPSYSSRYVVDDWCRRLATEVHHHRRAARRPTTAGMCEHVTDAIAGGLLKRLDDGVISLVCQVLPGRFMHSVLHNCPWCGQCLA